MKSLFRSAVDSFGRLTGVRRLPRLERASSVLDFYAFRRTHRDKPVFPGRYALYEFLNREVLKNESICYLEFGVFKGDSFRKWMELNTHPDSVFTGFDTFEGLPEAWNMGGGQVMPEGAFDVGGQLPRIDDARGSFVPGVFQATLLPFLAKGLPTRSRLVLHLDADLYSSTLFCLAQLYPFITAGTVLVFDELFNSIHEYRALQDWSQSHLMDYRVLGATTRFEQVAVEITRKRVHYRD
jgi:O-methyltransferase